MRRAGLPARTAVKRRETTTTRSQFAIHVCLRGSRRYLDLYVSDSTRAVCLRARCLARISSSVSLLSSFDEVKNISWDQRLPRRPGSGVGPDDSVRTAGVEASVASFDSAGETRGGDAIII